MSFAIILWREPAGIALRKENGQLSSLFGKVEQNPET